MSDRRGWRVAVAVVALIAVCGALYLGWRTYDERYVVATEGRDGLAVARVVRMTFAGASELKVGTLRGTVQSVAADSRLFGMVNSNRVMKAPFAVDYFVDLGGMGPADFRWDEPTRTLTVRPPAVRVGAVNVDESRTYLDRTSGIFVTRDAMAAMQRQASAGADRVAGEEARKPDQLAAAQRNARTALAAFLAAPLRAAGLGRVTVVVEFPGEARSRERWDTSRSLQEVLANAS